MAMSTPRLMGAVAGIGLLGAAAGVGAGVVTLPEPGAAAATGVAAPIAGPDVPAETPRPKPKVPVPDNTEALDEKALRYSTRTFPIRLPAPVTMALQIPKNWHETRPKEEEARFSDPYKKRWVRVENETSNFLPANEMRDRVTFLTKVQEAEDDARVLAQSVRSMTNSHGDELNVATISYTYIPDLAKRYTMVRWIGLGAGGNSAVEISVTGLPQDAKALAAILEKATDTVTREDAP